jgi:hypothetical protein
MKRLIKSLFNSAGYELSRRNFNLQHRFLGYDLEQEAHESLRVRDRTMLALPAGDNAVSAGDLLQGTKHPRQFEECGT